MSISFEKCFWCVIIYVEIFSAKELLKNGTSTEIVLKLCNDAYQIVGFLTEDYPKHKSWFYAKQLPETLNLDAKRDIIFAIKKPNYICGTAFLKNDTEKKICTLFVVPNERGQGIGSLLVEKAMNILNTSKPMITFDNGKYEMFKGLIEKYGWVQTQMLDNYYLEDKKELVFNGVLEK